MSEAIVAIEVELQLITNEGWYRRQSQLAARPQKLDVIRLDAEDASIELIVDMVELVDWSEHRRHPPGGLLIAYCHARDNLAMSKTALPQQLKKFGWEKV